MSAVIRLILGILCILVIIAVGMSTVLIKMPVWAIYASIPLDMLALAGLMYAIIGDYYVCGE